MARRSAVRVSEHSMWMRRSKAHAQRRRQSPTGPWARPTSWAISSSAAALKGEQDEGVRCRSRDGAVTAFRRV